MSRSPAGVVSDPVNVDLDEVLMASSELSFSWDCIAAVAENNTERKLSAGFPDAADLFWCECADLVGTGPGGEGWCTDGASDIVTRVVARVGGEGLGADTEGTCVCAGTEMAAAGSAAAGVGTDGAGSGTGAGTDGAGSGTDAGGEVAGTDGAGEGGTLPDGFSLAAVSLGSVM